MPSLATLTCAILATTVTAKTNAVFLANVVGVHDGDTLTVLEPANMVQLKIRLNGIDAPELGQAFGEKAKQALSTQVFGKKVRIVVSDVDLYDRSVGDVHVGTNWVNRQMVADGWAWHFLRYSKSKELATAEANARRKRLGLWRDSEPVPPWEFRKEERAK